MKLYIVWKMPFEASKPDIVMGYFKEELNAINFKNQLAEKDKKHLYSVQTTNFKD